MHYRVHGVLQARMLEWVAVPFSRAFSQRRDRTQVSHIAGGFFTSCATTEAHGKESACQNRRCKGHRFEDPGSRRSLQEEMATHFGILAWEIPWTEEPVGL